MNSHHQPFPAMVMNNPTAGEIILLRRILEEAATKIDESGDHGFICIGDGIVTLCKRGNGHVAVAFLVNIEDGVPASVGDLVDCLNLEWLADQKWLEIVEVEVN